MDNFIKGIYFFAGVLIIIIIIMFSFVTYILFLDHDSKAEQFCNNLTGEYSSFGTNTCSIKKIVDDIPLGTTYSIHGSDGFYYLKELKK